MLKNVITVVVSWILMRSEPSAMDVVIVSVVNVQNQWIVLLLAHGVKELKMKYVAGDSENVNSSQVRILQILRIQTW